LIEEANKYSPDDIENGIAPFDYNQRQLIKIFNLIKFWFDKYCVNNDPTDFSVKSRKLGLLIHGPRCIGKTIFCKSFLVDKDVQPESSPFIVYCKGSVTSVAFEEKKDTAQLVMLDDVTFDQKQKQMIKALIVATSTRIRSLHTDRFNFSRCCPCILLTNEIGTFNYFITSDDFKNDLVAISIEEAAPNTPQIYLGPPGTMPDRNKAMIYITPGNQAVLKKYREDKENAKKNIVFKVNNFNNN